MPNCIIVMHYTQKSNLNNTGGGFPLAMRQTTSFHPKMCLFGYKDFEINAWPSTFLTVLKIVQN